MRILKAYLQYNNILDRLIDACLFYPIAALTELLGRLAIRYNYTIC